MHPFLAAALAADGLVTRARLLEAGLSAHEVRRAARPGGELVVVRRGVYLPREQWAAADPLERRRWGDLAVHRTVLRPHLLSHDSAARLSRLSLLGGAAELAHVTRPGVRGSRTEHGVRHHRAAGVLGAGEVDGAPVTGLARTALDLAREHGLRQGLVTVTEVLRRGTTYGALQEVLRSMWCWPGSTDARAALRLADAGCESVGEVLTLELVRGLGVGTPQTQFAVRLDDGSVAFCDLRVGRHVVEFDGRVKYTRREDGGVADRPPGDVAWDERRRERAVMARGLGMSRVVWSDLWGPARAATARRLRAEVLETHARLGTTLPPDLRDFDALVRPRRVPWPAHSAM